MCTAIIQTETYKTRDQYFNIGLGVGFHKCDVVGMNESISFMPVLTDIERQIKWSVFVVNGYHTYKACKNLLRTIPKNFFYEQYAIYKGLKRKRDKNIYLSYSIFINYEHWMNNTRIGILKD